MEKRLYKIKCRAEKKFHDHHAVMDFDTGDEVIVAQCHGCGHIAVYRLEDCVPVIHG